MNQLKEAGSPIRWIELTAPGAKIGIMIGVILAFTLWSFTFLTTFLGSFWTRVTVSSIILALYAFLTAREKMSSEIEDFAFGDIIKGALGGVILYIFFHVGYSVFGTILEKGASNVYLIRLESPIVFIALSLVVTSFCEEFFWRAYIQRNLCAIKGTNTGIVATSLVYSLIHAPTMNTPLILAALIAGFFWGVLYHRTGNLWLVTASHMVWTELIFVFLPLL